MNFFSVLNPAAAHHSLRCTVRRPFLTVLGQTDRICETGIEARILNDQIQETAVSGEDSLRRDHSAQSSCRALRLDLFLVSERRMCVDLLTIHAGHQNVLRNDLRYGSSNSSFASMQSLSDIQSADRVQFAVAIVRTTEVRDRWITFARSTLPIIQQLQAERRHAS